MSKQFATYQVSLKLREIGFDELCYGCYTSKMNDDNFDQFWFSDQIWDNSDLHPNPRVCKNSDFGNVKSCAAPLWQDIIEWFIEKYDYNIEIRRNWLKLKYFYTIDHPILREVSKATCSYQKAREDAILKTIELCQNKKF